MGTYTCKFCGEQFTHNKFKNTCNSDCLKNLLYSNASIYLERKKLIVNNFL